ncbi:Uncharacterised protein [Mycobacteroides abscessus]|nr:Uncharacterised protein [Mycobacteroides abscessus]
MSSRTGIRGFAGAHWSSNDRSARSSRRLMNARSSTPCAANVASMPTLARSSSTALAYDSTPSSGVEAGSPRCFAISWNRSGAT